MIDSFVFLTPLLLLGVIALVGFVGCNQFFGIEETEPYPVPDPPTNLQAMPGDRQVTLTWDLNADATEYHVFRAEATGVAEGDYPVQRIVALSEIPYIDNINVTNGTKYFYRVAVVTNGGVSGVS